MSENLEKFHQNIEDVCKCALCLEIYQDPKSLPCRHSFCLECLHNLVVFDLSGKTSIKCPTCQKEHQFAKKQTVSNMNTELTLIQLLDVMKSSSVDTCVKTLLSCSSTDCQKSTSSLCLECYLQFCAKCDSIHSCTNKITIKESKTEGIRKFFCDMHGCFTSKFCVDCHKHLCIYCTNWEHDFKNHQVISLDQLEKQCREDLQVYDETLERFTKLFQEDHDEIVNWSDKNLSKLEEKINTLAESLKKSFEKIIDSIKEGYIQNLRDTINKLRVETKETLGIYEVLQRYNSSLPANCTPTEIVCKAGFVGAQLISEDTSLLHKDANFSVNFIADNSAFGNPFDLVTYFGKIDISLNSHMRKTIKPELTSKVLVIKNLEDKESSETALLRFAEEPRKFDFKTFCYSSYVTSNGVSWRLKARKMKKSLSVFVEVNLKGYQSCEADVEFIVRNIQGKDNIRDIKHNFSSAQYDWGYSEFLPFEELTKENGYVVNGKVFIEALVSTKSPLPKIPN